MTLLDGFLIAVITLKTTEKRYSLLERVGDAPQQQSRQTPEPSILLALTLLGVVNFRRSAASRSADRQLVFGDRT